jgi:hypothetical protein
MTTILPPNQFDSGGLVACTPDETAAANDSPQAQAAAAEYDSLMGDIGEIFAGARKLFDPDPAAYTNADQVYYDLLKAKDDPHAADLIAIPEGMWLEFDPAPLFLRQVG